MEVWLTPSSFAAVTDELILRLGSCETVGALWAQDLNPSTLYRGSYQQKQEKAGLDRKNPLKIPPRKGNLSQNLPSFPCQWWEFSPKPSLPRSVDLGPCRGERTRNARYKTGTARGLRLTTKRLNHLFCNASAVKSSDLEHCLPAWYQHSNDTNHPRKHQALKFCGTQPSGDLSLASGSMDSALSAQSQGSPLNLRGGLSETNSFTSFLSPTPMALFWGMKSHNL